MVVEPFMRWELLGGLDGGSRPQHSRSGIRLNLRFDRVNSEYCQWSMAAICKQRLNVCTHLVLALSSLALGACGLWPDASANEAQIEAKIALCVGIPAGDIDLSFDDDRNYADIGITHPPGRFVTEGHLAECMKTAGLNVDAEGL